ncbi:MAG TPA: hypothetical protein VMB05_07500 [Solirubrobacteraceae bacterium]|nr:hypothetical protein [Solirubrobacteraceae bacterium]HUB74477.1 hypothetical protein [Solirubrobacteraceae bacterium]
MTSGVETLLIIYAALTPEEQEEAYTQLRTRRLLTQDGAEREMEKYLRSLRRVAEAIGHTPGTEDYQEVSRALIADGEDIEPFSRLYRFFGRSWAQAQEALTLSGETTTKAIEARFAHRQFGKPVRYSEDQLRAALAACVEHFGRVPTTKEYVWWRERQLELARAKGEKQPHLPSEGPYRERWGGWEGGLLHFGYTPDAIAHRLARRERVFFIKDADNEASLPDGLPVAALGEAEAGCPPLSEDEAEAVREAYEAFPRRTKYVLTVRLGLGGQQRRILREIGDALGLHLSRVQQLQVYATDLLVEAIGEPKHARAGLRADVIEALRLMAGA